jgi:hypothetical protein
LRLPLHVFLFRFSSELVVQITSIHGAANRVSPQHIQPEGDKGTEALGRLRRSKQLQKTGTQRIREVIVRCGNVGHTIGA